VHTLDDNDTRIAEGWTLDQIVRERGLIKEEMWELERYTRQNDLTKEEGTEISRRINTLYAISNTILRKNSRNRTHIH
jgi:hypothetical protein